MNIKIAHTCRLRIKKKGEGNISNKGGIQRRTIATRKNLILNALTHHRLPQALHPKPVESGPVTTL